MRPILAALAAAALGACATAPGGSTAATPSGPRPAQYSRAAADTLYYVDSLTTDVTIAVQGQTIPMMMRQAGVYAVAFSGGDSARAWFDTLAISVESPMMGGIQRDTVIAQRLKQPATLTFRRNGVVEVLTLPPLPPQAQQVGDMRRQYADFFLRLPSAPLTAGYAWTDTLVRRDSSATNDITNTSIIQYTVRGDTTINEMLATVIGAVVRTTATGTSTGGPLPFQMELTGTENNTYYFSVAEGRMVGRDRQGALNGEMTPLATPDQKMKQTIKLRGKSMLVKGRG